MRRGKALSERGIFNARLIFGFSLALAGVLLGLFSVTAAPHRTFKQNTAAAAVAAASPAPSPSWAVVPSPNMTDQGFNAVTCVTSSDCWAVGSYFNVANLTNQSLIQHWNGGRWAIIAGGNLNTSQDNVLNAVTCTSSSNCIAVGYIGTSVQQTLIEQWNGSSWSVVTSPNNGTTVDNVLSAVTCNSATDCWAAGSRQVSGNLYQTLIERWNGVAWSLSTSANSSTTLTNILSGIDCTSSTNCFAVGTRSLSNGVQQTLIERWNGSNWSWLNTAPNTSTALDNSLNEVTCSAATDCWTVGYAKNAGGAAQTLIQRWNGTSWSIVASPNSSAMQPNQLLSVTCTSTTNCWAVGNSSNVNSVPQTLVERWNGTSWAIVSSPSSDPTLTNGLQSVACSSLTDCWAVGSNNNTFDQTLTERWNGTAWAIYASANIGVANTDASNSLAAVTCLSTNDCWAVGNFNAGTAQALILHWNGINWSIFSSPNTSPGQDNMLSGIACPSASNCWAVGMYQNGPVLQNLILHWDGTVWSIASSPNTAANQSNMLNGIACTSATQCVAVGSYTNANPASQTLTLQWNGVSWSIVPSPNIGSLQNNELDAVACSGANNCWAVGTVELGAPHQTLIEHWDGSSWTIVTSPNVFTMQDNFLNSVACSASSDCWAVGSFSFMGIAQPLIERWDGTSWGIVPSQNTSGTDNDVLFGVACSAPGDCSAAGYVSNVSNTLGFIQQWNGDAWKLLNAPSVPNTQDNSLMAATCLPGSDCWIVGMSDPNGNGVVQTLIEKRTVPVLSLTSFAPGAPGHVILSGKAVANSMVGIYAKSSLTDSFMLLNTVTADANGNYQYDDGSGGTRRFYRVHYP